MERDQYLKFQTRKELATAFINKLEKTEMADADLIPALLHWIETGDNDYFEEYKQFHFSKFPEEKENQLAEAKEKTEKIQAEIQKEIDEYEEYKKSYEKRLEDWQNWRDKICDEIDSQPSELLLPNYGFATLTPDNIVKIMADLYLKANPDKDVIDNAYLRRRSIYVESDGKRKRIYGMHLNKSGNFVLDTATQFTENPAIEPNAPKKPRNLFNIENPHIMEF